MGLGRLAGRGLAGWVQGGAGRGGFCKGDMAEWTQELETFAGASVSSGERRGRQLGPNSAGPERFEEWVMEASGPEGEGLWVPPGSMTPEVRDTPPLCALRPLLSPLVCSGDHLFFCGRELCFICLVLKADAYSQGGRQDGVTFSPLVWTSSRAKS